MKLPQIPQVAVDRPDHHDTARCGEPGCGGVLDFATDGHGRLVESCPRCEQRQRQRHGWRRAA